MTMCPEFHVEILVVQNVTARGQILHRTAACDASSRLYMLRCVWTQ